MLGNRTQIRTKWTGFAILCAETRDLPVAREPASTPVTCSSVAQTQENNSDTTDYY